MAEQASLVLENLTGRSLAVNVGPGIVLGPHASREISTEVAQNVNVKRMVRKGLLAVLPKPPHKGE